MGNPHTILANLPVSGGKLPLAFVPNGATSDFPFLNFTPLHAAIAMVASSCNTSTQQVDGGSVLLGALAESQRQLQASSLYVGDDATPFTIRHADTQSSAEYWSIALTDDKLQVTPPYSPENVFEIQGDMIACHAAVLEERDNDDFVEAESDFEVMRRRRLWTTSSIAATAMLSGTGKQFLQAGEIFSLILSPADTWIDTEISRLKRLTASIRAGLLIPDLASGKFNLHPSAIDWKLMLEQPQELWDSLGRMAVHAATLGKSTLQAIRSWAADKAETEEASGHDVLEAEEFLSHHPNAVDAHSKRLFDLISGFPSPPPVRTCH